jgi:predicted RNA binding protein YcfA (HicA-like mRNA interferase family)
MGNLDCIKLVKVQRLLKARGFFLIRQRGSHMIFVRDGLLRPIIIATHDKEVRFYNLKQICQILGMTKETLQEELKKY